MAALPARLAAALQAAGLAAPTALRGPLLAAVSGGGDSMALLHLAHGWCGDGRLHAATVDHGLRPAAAEEAAKVAAHCAALGIPHSILRGQDSLPGTGLQAAARRLRYRLLAEEAARIGAQAILLAHTLDDQAETVLMRQARGSGPAGLAGMAPALRRADLPGAPLLLRPLLGCTGAELRDWLRARGIGWVEDPSNRDPRFERVRLRQRLQAHAGRRGAGAGPAPLLLQLERRAARMRRKAQALDAAAAALLAEAVAPGRHGFDRLQLAPFRQAAPELAQHALRHLLATLGPGEYPPRRAAVARLWQALLQGCAGATLAGSRLLRADAAGIDGADYVLLRDRRQVLPDLLLAPGLAADWAGRFRVVSGSVLAPGLVLRELGEAGLRRVAATVPGGEALAAIPGPLRPVVPAVFDGTRPVALPSLDCGPAEARPALMRLPWPWQDGPGDALPQAERPSAAPGRAGSACSEASGVLSTGLLALPRAMAALG